MSALRKHTNVIPLRPEPDLASAYRATVTVHYPNVDELTMATRVELMGLRDRASAALRRCPPEAEPMLAEAARVASLAALANASTRALAFTRIAVESMIFAADMIRRAQA